MLFIYIYIKKKRNNSQKKYFDIQIYIIIKIIKKEKKELFKKLAGPRHRRVPIIVKEFEAIGIMGSVY